MLPLPVAEPELWAQPPDASSRQWDFATESLRELRHGSRRSGLKTLRSGVSRRGRSQAASVMKQQQLSLELG